MARDSQSIFTICTSVVTLKIGRHRLRLRSNCWLRLVRVDGPTVGFQPIIAVRRGRVDAIDTTTALAEVRQLRCSKSMR